MQEIIIATKNQGKRDEFRMLFSRYHIQIKSLLDLDEHIADIEETGTTFKANAQLKAEQISEMLRLPVIADDSGLTVDGLDGRPGIYSARFAGEPKSDDRNNEKLLHELNEHQNRKAAFICVLALARPDKKTLFAEGICEGEIGHVPRGTNGFGYDPLFIPNGYDKTMAELTSEQKNRISHRFRALEKLEKSLLQAGTLGDQHA